MIREASDSDSAPIAKALWNTWRKLKLQQIPTPSHLYSSCEALNREIRRDLSKWFVCESADLNVLGFFAISSMGADKAHKRWRFPENAVRVDHFACLQNSEMLLQQLQLLAAYFPGQSIELRVPSTLRDAYWAALKAGFVLLGECPLVIGTFAWLYLDRDGKFEEIQTRLRRDRVII